MMILLDKKASSVVEYTVLLIFIMSALIVMWNYITRGLSGRWKESGDSFGYGRQYQSGLTEECLFWKKETGGDWYDKKTFDQCKTNRQREFMELYLDCYKDCVPHEVWPCSGCPPEIKREGPCADGTEGVTWVKPPYTAPVPVPECHFCCETGAEEKRDAICLQPAVAQASRCNQELDSRFSSIEE